MEFNILLVVGGLGILLFGGEVLVKGAANLAFKFGISSMVIGLTVVAFGTSAPELLISSYSALTGSPDISMGNVIGSNICNLALVLPITALIYPIAVSKDSIKIDWTLTIGSAIVLLLLIFFDLKLSWYEGLILFSILVIYTYYLIKKTKSEDNNTEEGYKGGKAWVNILRIAGGAVALFLGSKFFVDGAIGIATHFEVSKLIIGLTVVAIGTSLPELVTSGIAAMKKDTDLALGNLLGSCIFNVLSILGITSMLTPFSGEGMAKDITVNPMLLDFPLGDFWWMLVIMLLLLPLMLINKKIAKVQSIVLLLIYVAYMYFKISNPV